MSDRGMLKWDQLVAKMAATGRYDVSRLDARKMRGLYHAGKSVVYMDAACEPWQIRGHFAQLEINSEYVELAMFYARDPRNGMGRKLFTEMMQRIDLGRRVVLITSDDATKKLSLEFGLRPVTRATLSNFGITCGIAPWATSIGLITEARDRVPETAYSNEMPDVGTSGRHLFMR